MRANDWNVMELLPIWPQIHEIRQISRRPRPKARMTNRYGGCARSSIPLSPASVLAAWEGKCRSCQTVRLMSNTKPKDTASSDKLCSNNGLPHRQGSSALKLVVLHIIEIFFKKALQWRVLLHTQSSFWLLLENPEYQSISMSKAIPVVFASLKAQLTIDSKTRFANDVKLKHLHRQSLQMTLD